VKPEICANVLLTCARLRGVTYISETKAHVFRDVNDVGPTLLVDLLSSIRKFDIISEDIGNSSDNGSSIHRNPEIYMLTAQNCIAVKENSSRK
jgi:hypothetical protein